MLFKNVQPTQKTSVQHEQIGVYLIVSIKDSPTLNRVLEELPILLVIHLQVLIFILTDKFN